MSFYKEVPGRKTTLESTLKFDTAPTAGSTNPVTSEGIASAITEAVGDVQSIIDNTPNIKNVQSDWNQTDSSKDEFIKNKPYFTKYSGPSAVKFKVCTVPKFTASSSNCGGIEVLYRIGDGGVYGELLYKVTYELYLKRIGNTSLNVSTLKFYYVDNPNNSSYIDIYADSNQYCTLTIAPLVNMPKDRADFTDFGTVVSSIPEGAAEVSKVWVANSAASSGTAPVKVDAYGALTPVPMDDVPTEGSTNLMTSGAIKAALDQLSARIAALE